MTLTPRMKRSTLKLTIVGLGLGLAFGLGGFTFIYAKGYSYLLNDPKACANCHVMNEQYDGWIKSTHHAVATCNDCHSPNGLVAKYVSKASNGFWHSFGFTTGRFPEPIRIKPHNREITENACRKCHGDLVDAIDMHATNGNNECLRCHNGVGHWK